MSDKQDKEGKKPAERGTAAKLESGNGVVIDNIRKEANLLENATQRAWPFKYEYLTGRFFSEVLAEECRKAGLPSDTFERDPPEDAVKRSPIPLKASPAIPKTTSAIIGHRSSRAEYNLEFAGRLYISPKWTMEPPTTNNLVLHTKQQKFIFLG